MLIEINLLILRMKLAYLVYSGTSKEKTGNPLIRGHRKMVELSMALSSLGSSPKFTVVSAVCTTPLFRRESFLRQKYEQERLSARQIAFLIGCSHSVINRALVQFGIKKIGQRSGWVEYGWKFKLGRRVPHRRQQIIIEQMYRMRRRGWTFQRIAQKLNERKISAPAGDKWYGATVGKILKRNNPNQK